MITMTLKQLPPILRALVKASGLKSRKFMILCTGEIGQTINDGAIRATLGNVPAEITPYHEGGGYRAQSPIVVVDAFGGGLTSPIPTAPRAKSPWRATSGLSSSGRMSPTPLDNRYHLIYN